MSFNVHNDDLSEYELTKIISQLGINSSFRRGGKAIIQSCPLIVINALSHDP